MKYIMLIHHEEVLDESERSDLLQENSVSESAS